MADPTPDPPEVGFRCTGDSTGGGSDTVEPEGSTVQNFEGFLLVREA